MTNALLSIIAGSLLLKLAIFFKDRQGKPDLSDWLMGFFGASLVSFGMFFTVLYIIGSLFYPFL